MRVTPLSIVVAGTLAPAVASGHLELLDPPSRYGGDVLKQGPCGRTGGTRGQNVVTYEAGETITLTWNEYTDHPGHYRVAFDEDGDNDFSDPKCIANCNTTTPSIEFYSDDTVLLDQIADKRGGDYSVSVKLPDVACTNCTLQVIQVMYDKPPYTLGGNDIYYQCIDLVITRQDGGCACAQQRGAPPLSSVLLLLGLFGRRER